MHELKIVYSTGFIIKTKNSHSFSLSYLSPSWNSNYTVCLIKKILKILKTINVEFFKSLQIIFILYPAKISRNVLSKNLKHNFYDWLAKSIECSSGVLHDFLQGKYLTLYLLILYTFLLMF